MHKYGQKLVVKTFLGDIREGIVKQVNDDGSLFVEIDEQILPNLNEDLTIFDRKGNPHTIYKSRFPNWQAWVKPEWVIGTVAQKEYDKHA